MTMLTWSTTVKSQQLKPNTNWIKIKISNNSSVLQTFSFFQIWYWRVKVTNPKHDYVNMVNHGQQSRTTNGHKCNLIDWVFMVFSRHLAALVVQKLCLGASFSSTASKRKVLFRGCDILEESTSSESCWSLMSHLVYKKWFIPSSLPMCILLGRIAINHWH